MKSAKSTEHVLAILLFSLGALLAARALGRAQVTEQKVIPVHPHPVPQKPPPPAPVKPPPKAPPQPQVVRHTTPPPRQGQTGGNVVAVKPTGGQGADLATEMHKGGGNNPPIGGVHPQGTGGSGGAQPGGFRLPPNARSMAMPGGGAAIVHPDGRRWMVDKDNQVRVFTRPGLQANYNSDGRLNSVHVVRPNNNLFVARSVRGERGTLGIRPGGVLVVTYGKGRGFVQRPIPGRMGYFQRTSMVGGRTYAHVYRAYRYRGVVYFRYVPANYYQPRFYGWVQNPWPAAAVYNWGQSPGPWMGFYAGYFTPAPAYPTAALWLTDFVLSENLKTAYQNHQEYEPSSTGPTPPNGTSAETAPLSTEVKNAIAQEAQQEIGEEQGASTLPGGQQPAAADQIPPVLDPHQRTFVVTQNLDVPLAGATCTLTPGDVIERQEDNLLPGNKVGVNVLTSKAGDCPAHTSTQIDVVILQEMHNQFREQIDDGLSTLADSEGQDGIPPGPVANARPVPEGTTQPDPDVAATLAQQQTDADSAEGAAADGQNAVSTM